MEALSAEARCLLGRLIEVDADTEAIMAGPEVWAEVRAALPVPDLAECSFCGDPTPIELADCQTCGVYLRSPQECRDVARYSPPPTLDVATLSAAVRPYQAGEGTPPSAASTGAAACKRASRPR